MKRASKRLAVAALTLGAGLLLPRPAAALQIFQEWRDPLFHLNGQWFTTSSIVDTSGLSGTGSESVLLTSLYAIEWLRLDPPDGGPDVGQNAYYAQFPVGPADGHIWADFVDGAFFRLRSVDVGGASLTILINDSTGTDTGARLSVGGGLLIYAGNHYDLYATSLVPEPEAAVLLTLGLLGLWRSGRRRA